MRVVLEGPRREWPGSALALAAALAIAWFAAVAGSGRARAADAFADLPVIERYELNDMRGRFLSGAGLTIEFGISVRTLIDGIPVFESVGILTEAGLVMEPRIPAAGAGPAPPGLTVVLDDRSASPVTLLTPVAIDLSGLAGAQGVVLTDDSGLIAALHRISPDQILNVVVQASTERIVEQHLELNVTVQNFTQFQQNAQLWQTLQQLFDRVQE